MPPTTISPPPTAEHADIEADELFLMRRNLQRAADRFRLEITAEPTFGRRLRSIGAPVRDARGQRWLRVVTAPHETAHGEWWTGNADANALPMHIAKPYVVDKIEWDDRKCRRRAEVMTLLPGEPCSRDEAPPADLRLSTAWWVALRRTSTTIADAPTQRVHADQNQVSNRIRETFGECADTHVGRWETAHGNLHWNNLFRHEFGLVDWACWGRAPAGTDAATLYCSSLLSPAARRAVRAHFHDVLDSAAGRVAQLHVAARMLVEKGDHRDFVAALRAHARTLLAAS
jgi:hypothetical protein